MFTDSGRAKTLEYDCHKPSICSGDGLGSKFDGKSGPKVILGPDAHESAQSGPIE